MDWIVARVTDSQGTVLPRETIMLGNRAPVEQQGIGQPAEGQLLSREAVREASTNVSEERVSGYLAEFPEVEEHIKRFRGQTTATFTRDELLELMSGSEAFRRRDARPPVRGRHGRAHPWHDRDRRDIRDPTALPRGPRTRDPRARLIAGRGRSPRFDPAMDPESAHRVSGVRGERARHRGSTSR